MKKIFISMMLTLLTSVAAWAEEPYYEIVAGDLSASSMTITLKVTFPDATTVDPYFMTNYEANLYNKYNLLMAYKSNNVGVEIDGNSFILPLYVYQNSDDTDDLRLELKKFSLKIDGEFVTSNLSIYQKPETSAEPPYFWVKNISGNDAGFMLYPDTGIEYTKDPEGEWKTATTYWTIILANDEKVYLRSTSPNLEKVFRPYLAEFDYAIGGDITTLLAPEGNIDEIPDGAGFLGLFEDQTYLVDASELKLIPTKLSIGCYDSMFRGCTNLVAAPVLPALELVPLCYADMFHGCSKLDYVKAYFADWGAPEDMCTRDWLDGAAPVGTFEGHAWVAGCCYDHVPYGWGAADIKSMDIIVPETGYTTFGYFNDKYNWIMPEGMEGYIAFSWWDNEEGGRLIINKAYEAGEIVLSRFHDMALLLKAKPGKYTINFTEEDGKECFSSNIMAEPMTFDLSNNYWANDYRYFILSTDENGENVGFYPVEGDGRPFVTPPFQGYLRLEQYNFPDGEVHPYLIELDDDSDGIHNVTAPRQPAVYDLSGQRLSQPKKGLNIINGKKVMIQL